MLTKDLLLYRTQKGQVKPTFVDPAAPDLLAFCELLIVVPTTGLGIERGTLEERAAEQATGFAKPKVAAGLTKLLFDRMTFEEPSDAAATLRLASFTASARVLRELPDGATAEAFEAQLSAALPSPIEGIREQLYADHPENRRLIEWEPLTPTELLHRYNMAQVQGLVLRAERLSVRAIAPELLRVRKLLRWLKFCRLVPEVQTVGDDLLIEVDGPASILSMEKKYGLQLAQFVAMVPVLARYELRAEIAFSRSRPALLALDEKSGLVANNQQALGHIPPEIDVILKKLADGPWKIDATPVPRPVGASGLCVPDIAFRMGRRTLAIEFFHAWHHHALRRRLADLKTRPDPELVLAVDEKLLKEDGLRGDIEGQSQVMLFKGFPSERGLRKLLDDRLP